MRSISPHPIRNSSYARSRSFSYNATSRNPALLYRDTTFTYPERAPSLSPCPRRVSRARSEGGLDSVFERTLEDSERDEEQPLVKDGDTVTALYGRRWYLLLLFSLLALLQTLSWAVWGPIAQSAEAVLSWGDSQITMCVFLGNLTFCFGCIPFSWLMDYKGLRVSMVVSCFFVMVGAGVRCLVHFVPSSYYIWCIYGGQLLNGVAGPVAQGGGALFSNLWFPNNQRATSTAISTFIGYSGSALSFVLGPLLVPSPADDPNNGNNTQPDGNNTRQMGELMKITVDSGNSSESTVIMDAILSYMDYQAAAAVVLFLLVVVYFPDKPPRPPSLSAATEREDFGPGLAKLLKNKQFWLISAAFCLSLGVFEVWDVVLDVNLSAIGISQETAGWLGFYCVMAGCITGLVICRLADIFFRQIRLFLILAYVLSAIFVLWFLLIYIGILPFDIASIYAAIILSGVFLDGCCPLVYELMCEAAYPVSEGVSSCFLQMLFVLVGMAFAAVQNVPNIGTEWMNWCLLGTLCAAIPLLICVTDTYNRADLDDLEDQVTVVGPTDNPSTQQDHSEKESLLAVPRSTPSPASFLSRSHHDYGACSCPPKLSYNTIPHPPTTAADSDTADHSHPNPRVIFQAEWSSGPRSPATHDASCCDVRRNPRVLEGWQRTGAPSTNQQSTVTHLPSPFTVRLNASFQGTDKNVVDDDGRKVPDDDKNARADNGVKPVDNLGDGNTDVFEYDASYRDGRSTSRTSRRSANRTNRSSESRRSASITSRHSANRTNRSSESGRSVSRTSRRSESSSPNSGTGSLLTSNPSVDLSFLRVE